jgi:hypothetical protein
MKLAQDMGGADPAAIAGPLAGIVRGLVTKASFCPDILHKDLKRIWAISSCQASNSCLAERALQKDN